MSLPSLEGKTLGKYQLLEPLGRGGVAQVYKAYHPQLDRYVAIKMLRSDLVEEEEFLARFQREARSVAALRHPNIVQVFDFDIQDGRYYMVLELLEGDTLRTVLNSYRAAGEKIPTGHMLRILLDILAGLDYAHRAGIVHRDIKPTNIMLTKGGQAVVTDFGIAQIVGGAQYTVSGALMGTLSYMAPEQGLTGKCDARSDIYSLGIIYYEMLTGQVPFDAETPLAVLMKHVNDPLPLPHRLDSNIPEPLERVALKALAKKPENRFQSAQEMYTALSDAAVQIKLSIPDTLPHLNKPGPASVTKSVTVFSGSARQNIADRGFEKDNTETTLKPHSPLKIPPAVHRLFKVPPQINEQDVTVEHVTRGVLVAVITLILVNLCGVWISGITQWSFFVYAWPMELALVSLILLALAVSLASAWLLIPGGIVLGNAVIFTYFALTDRWSNWSIVWPLEPAVLAAFIVIPILLGLSGLEGRWISRILGRILALVAMALIVLLIAASVFLTIKH
jgi:serine/threonine protein kinase